MTKLHLMAIDTVERAMVVEHICNHLILNSRNIFVLIDHGYAYVKRTYKTRKLSKMYL